MTKRERARTGAASSPGLQVEVRILRIATGGDGVGRLPDGRTVFVPRTAPGDLVAVTPVHEARRFVRGRLEQLLEPGPNRVLPPCTHYTRDRCGGCQLQHLTPAAQLSARQSIIGETLRRVGHLEVGDPPVLPAEQAWEYRTRITLATDQRGRLGLHPLARPAEVFDLERCLITDAGLMDLWARLRPLRSQLPPDLVHLVLRLGADGRRHVIAETRGERAWTGAGELHRQLTEAGLPAVLWWHPAGGAPRVVAGASDYPVSAFEQVHPGMGRTVRAFALDQLGPVDGLLVWDLYAGLGESARLLSERGARVHAVESDPRAVREAQALGSRGTGVIEYHQGKVEDLVDGLPSPDLVLANPPRAGMDAAVAAALVERRPTRLVYISCDPATLARDLERLAQAYRVAGLQGFDLFPQTAHVETVAVVERR